MNGIDVSYAQGKIDWAGAAAEGVEFAMVKASQGRLLADPDSGPFPDPRFAENVRGASAAGIPVGVYHYLCAGTTEEAEAEADFFLGVIAPYRKQISLWAVCDAEEEKYLPRDRETLGALVDAFLTRVAAAGWKPMLYSNPDFLTYRLPDMRRYDLWLAYWGTTEARALSYDPKIWQYGTDAVANMRVVDVNRGYFSVKEMERPEEDEKPAPDGAGIFKDHPVDDDGILVSGGSLRGDSGGDSQRRGRLFPLGLRAFVHRDADERRGGIVHDKNRLREQREDPPKRRK